jgi:SAM-dependent methyltransferase
MKSTAARYQAAAMAHCILSDKDLIRGIALRAPCSPSPPIGRFEVGVVSNAVTIASYSPEARSVPSANRYATLVRQLFDERWSRQYRQIDERTDDDAFEHYGALLQQLSSSFGRPIDVLDIGCGTGRYFHRLRNVHRLVGLDLSPHMLEQARSPLRALEVRADSIDLICGELQSAAFAEGSFDFAYSVGVLGEYSPLDASFLSLCARVLRPGGMLFVTAVDALSRVSVPEHQRASLLRRVFRKAWPVLPAPARLVFNHWLSPFYANRTQLEKLLVASEFSSYTITSYVHRSGWVGTHFDCQATKNSG